MKQFELRLARYDTLNPNTIKSIDTIQGDSLVEVLSQLNMVIMRTQRDICKEQKEDGIPF